MSRWLKSVTSGLISKPERRDNEYVVGVFEHVRRSGRVFLMAYTRDYNPAWEGCCVHRVISEGGRYAKEDAKAQHRRECMAGRRPV